MKLTDTLVNIRELNSKPSGYQRRVWLFYEKYNKKSRFTSCYRRDKGNRQVRYDKSVLFTGAA